MSVLHSLSIVGSSSMEISNFLLRPIGNRVFDSCHRAQKLHFHFRLRFWFHFATDHVQLYFSYTGQCVGSSAIFFFLVYLVSSIFYDTLKKRVLYSRLGVTLMRTVGTGNVA
jgi:hypothetical protein